MLGLYDLLGRLTADFPEVLFEGCAGGGGRFDAGYALLLPPRSGCSDDTDAITGSRSSTALPSAIRPAPWAATSPPPPTTRPGAAPLLSTRAVVAMAGAFGYELDLQKLTGDEKEMVKAQIVRCKQLQPLSWRAGASG